MRRPRPALFAVALDLALAAMLTAGLTVLLHSGLRRLPQDGLAQGGGASIGSARAAAFLSFPHQASEAVR